MTGREGELDTDRNMPARGITADEANHLIEHGTSPEAEAVRLLRRFACTPAGRAVVNYGLVRPFRMGPGEPRPMEHNLEARPSVGWHLACASCDYNLTSHHGEYVAWHDGDDMSGVESDVDAWSGEPCPSCGVDLGDRLCDGCGEANKPDELNHESGDALCAKCDEEARADVP